LNECFERMLRTSAFERMFLGPFLNERIWTVLSVADIIH